METKKETRTGWLGHAEWAVLMVTLLGGVYLLDAKIERQSARTDRLYEMFIEVVKERNASYAGSSTPAPDGEVLVHMAGRTQ